MRHHNSFEQISSHWTFTGSAHLFYLGEKVIPLISTLVSSPLFTKVNALVTVKLCNHCLKLLQWHDDTKLGDSYWLCENCCKLAEDMQAGRTSTQTQATTSKETLKLEPAQPTLPKEITCSQTQGKTSRETSEVESANYCTELAVTSCSCVML